MRLLNARTYEFHIVLGVDKPNYAIFSHTWEDGEVLFDDIRDTSKIEWSSREGFFKIKKTCEQALQDGCEFVWIDTCNINKDSSAELSEAINSMFRWYRDATICYAYISDRKVGDGRSLSECRWLTRGWTLQEMIAPDRVHFYDMDWTFLGSRISLAWWLSATTGIHESVLLRRHPAGILPNTAASGYKTDRTSINEPTGEVCGTSSSRTITGDCQCCLDAEEEGAQSMLDRFSVAQKMKWASKRTTTREEDLAYCLMGLFDVNMPLLYGEGAKAFCRLQKAILEMSLDHSILAFRSDSRSAHAADESSLLARHPALFRDEISYMHMPARGTHASLSGTTLSIEMLICPLPRSDGQKYLGILDCSIDGDSSMRPAIELSAVNIEKLIFRQSTFPLGLYRLGSKHPMYAILICDNEGDPATLRPSHQIWQYSPSSITRNRITILGGGIAEARQRHAQAPIRVNISSIFGDLGYQTTPPPFQFDQHWPRPTPHVGTIEFSSSFGESLFVGWDLSYEKLFCCIEDSNNRRAEEIKLSNMEFESRDTCVTTGLTELCKSNPLLISGLRTAVLAVWISVSRETFIGRSRMELGVHGKIVRGIGDGVGKDAWLRPQSLSSGAQLDDSTSEEDG